MSDESLTTPRRGRDGGDPLRRPPETPGRKATFQH